MTNENTKQEITEMNKSPNNRPDIKKWLDTKVVTEGDVLSKDVEKFRETILNNRHLIATADKSDGL